MYVTEYVFGKVYVSKYLNNKHLTNRKFNNAIVMLFEKSFSNNHCN